ncbi:hypothetical protein llap_3292 [Limosa lapponica baueri]|uniref:Uncharacterized protein n=1 Tax=Limosa lapponica baueri TaxID=1758121 RepID=A0A2I0UK28_LIMLA|nr:hypothetical protein llap_3292 [Limosa lapponica baueri]
MSPEQAKIERLKSEMRLRQNKKAMPYQGSFETAAKQLSGFKGVPIVALPQFFIKWDAVFNMIPMKETLPSRGAHAYPYEVFY